jgi:hypothetical protein
MPTTTPRLIPQPLHALPCVRLAHWKPKALAELAAAPLGPGKSERRAAGQPAPPRAALAEAVTVWNDGTEGPPAFGLVKRHAGEAKFRAVLTLLQVPHELGRYVDEQGAVEALRDAAGRQLATWRQQRARRP